MVWHEVGKYGIRNGRTLRSPSKPAQASPHTKAGYITKVVMNGTKALETDEIKKHLKNFKFPDGFESGSVVSESSYRAFDLLWPAEWDRGYKSSDLVLSINKRKRWLLPKLLREKLIEDNDRFEEKSTSDPRIVLIERKSADNDIFQRRTRADCFSVLDSKDKSSLTEKKQKTRKLFHVGDKYKGSDGTEIAYEVCESRFENSWPSYKETRANAARFNFCYEALTKHGKKLKKQEMIKQSLADIDYLDVDCDEYDDDDEIPVGEVNDDYCHHEIDLGEYIAKAAVTTKRHSKQRRHKSGDKSNCRSTVNINPASSEPVQCYGKGCTKIIECKQKAEKSNNNNTINLEASPASANATIKSNMESDTVVKTFKLSILTDSLQSDGLRERFKSRYEEGGSHPRKLIIAAPFCQHQYLLFEPDNDEDNDGSCETRLTLLCDERKNTYSNESDLYTITNSCNKLAQLESQGRILAIGEIADVFESSCTCCGESKGRCDSKRESSKIRKTVVPFDVLNSLNGHKTEVCSLMEATKEISSENCQNLEEISTKPLKSSSLTNLKACEICYAESNESIQGFTGLLTCKHWFCNDCWKEYLVSQLQQGKSIVYCPALDCSETVDDATFMSLAPKCYFKYRSIQDERAFELSKQWKWCPGDKCQLVAKMVNSKRHATRMDKQDHQLDTCLPCMCSCSQIWCFGCQEEPHWPAACDQAKNFRNRTKKYQELVSSVGDRVTSVCIRRCPNCGYPVEKDGGCPHMMCTKCNGEFCWTCLSIWGNGMHECEIDVKSEEIELTDFIGNARFNKHVKILMFHKKERKVNSLFKMYQTVEKVSNAVNSNHEHLQFTDNTKQKLPSKPQAFLRTCCQHNIPEKLKLMVDIKFISHSVIEGAAMYMATSKTKHGHHKLHRLINDLYFVVARLEHYLAKKLEELCSVLDQVMVLVESAKKLIVAIGKVTNK